MPLGSRSFADYLPHLPCQHSDEGDDNTRDMNPEAARVTFSSHCGRLCTMMNLASPPTVAAAGLAGVVAFLRL